MNNQKEFGFLLGRAFHLFHSRLQAKIRKYDITPSQTRTLLYLCHRGGSVPQGELTAFLRVKPSSTNGTLDKLEEKGLITRAISGDDARQRCISITGRGQQQQELLTQNFLAMEQRITCDFTPEEKETLRVLLLRVIHNLEEDEHS